MSDIDHPISSARTYIWVILLGSVGFYFGYNGQFLLLKETGDTIAPLLGLFLTGPAGLFLGLLLGTLSTRLQLSARQNFIFLATSAVVVSVGILALIASDYKQTVRLIDAEIYNCKKIDKLLESQAKFWSELDANHNIRARPNYWEQDFPDMVQVQPGALLMIQVYQEAWVSELHWRSGRISKKVDNWKDKNELIQVFAPVAGSAAHSPCDPFVVGERKFSSMQWEKSNSEPPEKLSRFVWLPAFKPVPPEYVRYIPKSK